MPAASVTRNVVGLAAVSGETTPSVPRDTSMGVPGTGGLKRTVTVSPSVTTRIGGWNPCGRANATQTRVGSAERLQQYPPRTASIWPDALTSTTFGGSSVQGWPVHGLASVVLVVVSATLAVVVDVDVVDVV